MTIKDTDKFIAERIVGGEPKNFSLEAEQFKSFVPSLEPGTIAVFYNNISQVSPLGWTQVTGINNDTALRIVKNGGSVGGSTPFTDVFKSRPIPLGEHKHSISESKHGHTSKLAKHGHGVNGGSHGHSSSTTTTHTHKGGTTNNASTGGADSFLRSMNAPTKVGTSTKNSSAKSTINASGVSFSMNNATVSKVSGTSNYTTRPSLTSGGDGSNPSLNFEIKYANVILCSKDPF